MIDVKIKDGSGGGHSAKVDYTNRLHVQNHNLPAFGGPEEVCLYRSYFKNSAGSNVMKVDGSTTNVDFTITSDQLKDRIISTISFVIADSASDLSKFGAITALTNGVFFFFEGCHGPTTIHEALKTNWDFVRLSGGNPPFGNAIAAFRALNVEGQADAYIPVIDFKRIFGLPFGLRLSAGSSQRLVLRVKDNLTGVDSFNAIAYGFDRSNEESYV